MNNDRNGLGFKLGFDYFINDMNTISLSGAYDLRSGGRDSRNERSETFNDTTTGFVTINNNERISDNYEINFDYTTKFNTKGHQLYTSLNFEAETPGSGSNEELKEYTLPNLINPTTSYKHIDDNPEWELRFKSDYTNPYSEHGKVEAGIQYDADHALYQVEFQEGDPDLPNQWQTVDSLTQDFRIDRDVYSAYGLYSNRLFWNVDIQAGLRLEYINRIVKSDKDYTLQRPDFFPSLHVSKKFDDQNQLMMGYTRRIRRPREWSLNPMRRYWDSRTINEGNPDLKPEYSNMYEINYQFSKNRSFVSFEVYHRQEINIMDRTRVIYGQTVINGREQPIFIQSSVNVGERYSTGFEVMANLSLKQVININGSVSLYHMKFEKDPEFQLPGLETEDFSWRSRFNVTYTTPWKGRLQVNGFYNAKSITAQGESEGFAVFNGAYRQDFLDRKFTVTLQARDIFQSMNFERTFYLEQNEGTSSFKRESPVITLTLSYKINNYKNRQRDRNMEGEGNFESEGGGESDIF